MSCMYEEEYGKLDLPPRLNTTALALVVPHDNASTDAGDQDFYTKLTNEISDVDDPSLPPARAYAEIYHHSVVRSVLIADKCMRLSRRDHRVEEAHLWSLLLELLLDAEQSPKYNPDAIGLMSVQPHRRWYLSHHAHVQDLLQRHPLLRRMNIVLRWLEQTYREGNAPLRLTASRSPEEAVLLRQIILSNLRGGELHRAIDLAVTARDCTYSCVLSAAQMHSVAEPWLHLTPLVPLFGEYGNGEVDQSWAGNARRLDNLSQLYADSSCSTAAPSTTAPPTAAAGLDALIAAVLCGNLDAMEPAFLSAGSWRDALWCHLRSALVLCFTKALMAAGAQGVRPAYAALVERVTGAGDVWAEDAARGAVRRLSARLRDLYLRGATLEEQLQMRVILQFLSPDGGVDWLAIPAADIIGSNSNNNNSNNSSGEAARLIAHVLLCLDVAYSEALHGHSVQAHSDALAHALTQHAQHMARLPHYAPPDAMASVTAMALRLRDARQRAAVYAAFLVAVRTRELAQPHVVRADVERREERLVRIVCRADADDAVREEVLRLLHRCTAPAALLTHSAATEAIMWRAMHAGSRGDFVRLLRDALAACGGFWLAEPHAELDAIADVAAVLSRSVLPALAAQRQHENEKNETQVEEGVEGVEGVEEEEEGEEEEGEYDIAEAQFWITLSALRAAADLHARSAAQLDVAGASGAERTLVFQLAQDEAGRVRELHALAQSAVDCGGAVVRRVRACVTAVAWAAQTFAEEAALSARLAPIGAAHERLRDVFALIERMDALGYIDERLLTRNSAKELFDAVRAVRVAVGQRAHDELVAAARRAAAAQVRVDGYGEGAEE